MNFLHLLQDLRTRWFATSGKPSIVKPRRKRARLRLEALEDRTLLSASVATNLPDYSPGQTAVITGSGFQANETVDLQVLNESVTPVAPAGSPGSWTVQADASGAFQTSWTCTSDLAGTNLELDAKGESSGLTASEAFTDSTHTNLSLNINPGTVTIGGSVTFKATLTAGSPGTPLSGQIVDFSTGSTDFGIATTDSNGVATKTLSSVSLPASSTAYTITATYSGIQGQFTPATATGSLTVNPITPTVTASAANEQYDGAAYDLSNVTHTISPSNATGTFTDVFFSDAAGTNVIADPTNAGTYYVQVQFASSDTTQWANANSNITSFQITKANATINVTGYTVTYDSSTHTATATATGVGGVDLSSELNLSSTTHANAGITTDTWTFTDTAGNYNSTSATVRDTIGRRDLFVTANSNSKTYGQTASDTGSLTGVQGNDGISASYASAGDNANAAVGSGSYAITALFSDPKNKLGNYTVHETDATLTVNQATATINVTPYSLTYDGSAHTATATATGVFNENLSSGLTLSGTTHTNAGTYSDGWTFHDAAGNYKDAGAGLSDSIGQRDLFVTATSNSKTYGQTASDTGTISGVQGSDGITVSFASTGDNANAAVGSGSYAITGTLSDPNNRLANYLLHKADATLTVNQATATIQVTPYSLTYDGSAHTATSTATGVFNEDLSSGLTLSGTTHTDAGSYTDGWSFHDARGNYKDAGAGLSDSIGKRDLYVTAADNSKTYGDTASDTGSLTGVQGGDGISAGFASAGDDAHADVGTGTYTITGTLSDPGNRLGNYNLHKADATLTVNQAGATISVTPYSVTYDANSHSASGSATGVFGEDLAPGLDLADGTTHTDAGTYTDSWSFHDAAGNYKDAGAGLSDSIGKRDLFVTAADNSKTYGDTASDTGSLTGVQGNDGITVGFASAGDDAHADVGSGSYAITGTLADPNGRLGNYNLHRADATLTVRQADAAINVTGYSVTYDGSAHSATGTAHGVFGEDLGAGLDLADGTTHTDAGTYTDSWSFHDAAGNYKDAGAGLSDSIGKRDLYVTAADNSKTYGDTASDTGSLTGVQGGDGISAGFASAGDDAHADVGTGSYTITGTLSDPGNRLGNYNLHRADATLTVHQADAAISVAGYSVTYDANSHTATGTARGVFGEDLGAGLDLADGTTHTDAGTYTDTWAFHDARSNYKDAHDAVGDSIGKRDLYVTAADNSKTYGDNASDSGSVSGLVASDGISAGFASAGDDAHADVGTGSYAITGTLSDPGNRLGNYLLHRTDATLTVNQATATIQVTPYSVTYDGNSHSATGSATGVFGEDLAPGLDLADGTTHTDAGSYSDGWTFHDARGNYKDAGAGLSDSIGKRDLYVTASDNSKTYGDTASDTGTITGVQGGDGISAGFASAGDDAHADVGTGSYTITGTLSDPGNRLGNYLLHKADATLTVNQADATISVTPYSVTYDGSAHSATGSATGVFGEDLAPGLDLADGTTHTDAGTYTDSWTFHDARGNYKDAGAGLSDSIGRRDLYVTASDNSKTYGDTASDSGTITGVQGGDGISAGFASAGDDAHADVGTGSYTITGTLSDPGNRLGNYLLHKADATLTVHQADAAISVAGYSVTYDGNSHSASGSATGVFGEDLAPGLDLADGTTHTDAGTYADSWAFHDARGNYKDAHDAVGDSIGRRDLYVTASDNNKTYGDNASDTGSVSGLVDSDGIAVSFASAGDDAHADVGTGSYTITGTLSDPGNRLGNYNLHRADATLTVHQADAAISVAGYSVTYDANSHSATGSARGVFGEDLGAGLDLADGTTHTDAGTYSDAWTFHDARGNYKDAHDAVGDSIGKRDLYVTAADNSKTYGDTASDSGTISGVQGNDGITAGFASAGDDAHADVGTGSYAITGTLSDPGKRLGNYNLHKTDATLTIHRATATIVLTPYSVTYDGSAHTATGSATGVFDEDLTSGLDLSATTHTNVGTYTDTWTFTDTTGNYTHVFNGTITDSIAQATPSGTVGPDDINYGTALDGSQLGGSLGGVAGSFAFTGPDNGAVLHVSGSPYTEAYTFTPTDTADYNSVSGTATVVVSPAPLTVTADGQEITYGQPLPTFTATAKGLVNGDTLASLGGVAFGGDSQTAVHAGSYTITVSGPTTGDYTVIDVPGTLTIDKATLIVKEDNATMFVGAALPTFTGNIVSGVVDHDNVSLSFQAVDSHGNPVTGNTLGTFAIVATPNNSDYQVAYAPQGTLSVLPVIVNTAVASTRPSSSPSPSNGSSQPASPGFDFMTAFQALELDVFYLTLYEAAAAAVSFADPVLDYYVNVLLMALYGNPLAFTPSGMYAEVLGAEMAQPFLTLA